LLTLDLLEQHRGCHYGLNRVESAYPVLLSHFICEHGHRHTTPDFVRQFPQDALVNSHPDQLSHSRYAFLVATQRSVGLRA
jgi:hypothetical protein